MTDRPIIFSGPMVRALLDGRKTQTRRLVTSPLRKCEIGDRLYVREAFADTQGMGFDSRFHFMVDTRPDSEGDEIRKAYGVKWRPSIHMPRIASRITLTITDVRLQELNRIDDQDAMAEGIKRIRDHCFVGDGTGYDKVGLCHSAPSTAFACLWDELHDKENQRWEDNPEIVALTFTVDQKNIDQ